MSEGDVYVEELLIGVPLHPGIKIHFLRTASVSDTSPHHWFSPESSTYSQGDDSRITPREGNRGCNLV